MKEGKLQIYCGSGKGKTTAAIGQAIREASRGRSVFVGSSGIPVGEKCHLLQ